MSFPSVKVEFAFDSGFATPEGDRTWTDVSDFVEGGEPVGIQYGRADELSTPDPNQLSLTLDNRDGRFTPGKASSPYYPNVKKGKPVRVSVRYSDDGAGNFLSANQASMETSIADWSAGGSVPPTLAQSATHADNGTNALRITWGTGGVLPLAQTTIDDRVVAGGLVVGRQYIAQARVWVTAGTPDVKLAIAGVGSGTATSTKGTFASISITFVATASSHLLQVWPNSAPTAGQQCWVDSVMVDEGSSVGTFTTSPPPIFTRFTGYVNEWPLVWPDGSSAASTISITAASRRARLGQTAPLTSAIRAAYLESSPDAYWTMSDEILNSSGQYVFFDITNTLVNNKPTQALATFNNDLSKLILLHDAPGPTDEGGMVKLPSFTNFASVGTYLRYVGGAGTFKVNTGAGYASVEVVARIAPTGPGDVNVNLIDLSAPAHENLLSVTAIDKTAANQGAAVAGSFLVRNPDTGALIENEGDGSFTLYDTAADGELHHYAFVLDSAGTVGRVYFDGVQIGTLSMANPINKILNRVAFGGDAYNADVWVGHGAVYDRALTSAEVLAHAQAATAATETVEERIVRVAGRIGVPADEVDVETSIAGLLGPQPEAGRSASEVMDEAATSTGSVLYDTRAGHIAMSARNSRYNLASSFSLSAQLQEIQGDLTIVDDHRYTINTVEFTRADSEDVPATLTDDDSIDEYGVFAQSYSVVSSSPTEVEGFASNILARYADPEPRVSQVSVDVVNIDSAKRVSVLSADIGTRFGLASLAAQAPTDPMYVFFEGASEQITATSHTMTINTTPADLFQNVMITDDAIRGATDSTNVAAY